MEDGSMKKIVVIFAALCVCMISCNKELTDSQNNVTAPEVAMKIVTITATIDDDLTKTSYAGGTTFSWTAGDEISVLCSDDVFHTFTANSTGTTTTFTGSLPDGVSLGSYAFFPADAGHTREGLKFNIPEEKDLTSHPSADLPMVGDKGEGNAYSFMHCSGAALFSLKNIPSNIVAVEISFVSASLKLSGLFGVFKSGPSSDEWRWNAAGGSTTSEKTFKRKVSVINHQAEVYLPYAWGANMWANNSVTIKGYDSSDNEYAIITDKTMKGDGSYDYVRAHVRPLTPLILNNLDRIDWSGISGYSGDGNYAAFKVTSDDYYIYFYSKVKKGQVKWGTTDGAGENGTYIYYGVDTDKNASTGTDFWGNAGKFNSIVLVYPYNMDETIRTAPYIKVNGTRYYSSCTGTVGDGEGAMVESAIAILRTDIGVTTGTEVNVYSYASSNVGQYTSEFLVTL